MITIQSKCLVCKKSYCKPLGQWPCICTACRHTTEAMKIMTEPDFIKMAKEHGLDIHEVAPGLYQGRFDEEWVTDPYNDEKKVAIEWLIYEGYHEDN